jgi:hypothetical protein
MDVKIMTLAQESLELIPEDLGVISPEPDGLEDLEPKRGRFSKLISRSRVYFLVLAFAVGVLLGWLVIGWWLWPVQWSNSQPWQLSPQHQRTFVHLLAEDYWQTSDISQAREALAGWDEEDLARLLSTMQNQASSSEERQHLAALAEALEMPDVGESLLASLLSQKMILLSFIVSGSPLVVAIAIAAYSLVQNRTQRVEAPVVGEEQLEEALEELLGQEEEQAERRDQGEGEEGGQQGQQQEAQGTEEDQEGQAEDDEDEEEDEEDEEEDDASPWVQDLVADLFDDDAPEIAALETLCKKLPEIEVSDLMEFAKKVASELHQVNALR